MKILFIIPARGGSKGLPGKNIKDLQGKPLIAYAIEAAKNSGISGDIIVSTDNEQIAETAKKFGAQVPFLRPEILSGDKASGMDVIFHAVDFAKMHGTIYDFVIVLQPTSPLRTGDDIKNAFDLLNEKKAQAVVSVSVCDHHPLWTNTLPDDKFMGNFMKPEIKDKQRQELPEFYQINGAIYMGYLSYIKEKKVFVGDKTVAYIMPAERSVDIDTEKDLVLANYFLEKSKK